jgi:glycosyltransferase involved in cell wall biosynthesis
MKVLLVCHRYPPLGVAGVERLSAQTAEALRARGHEVTVLTRRESPSPALTLERWTQDGVPVVSIVGGGFQFERFPVHEPALERIFERMLTELGPDVVLATHLLQHSPGYVDVAHRWRTPIVLELHDFFALCPRAHLQRRSGDLCDGPEGGKACAEHCFGDQRDAQLRWALRSRSFAEALRRADAVVAPSRYVADVLAPRRAEGSPIEVIENAVTAFGPVLRSAPEPGAPLRFASIGVTVDHKGFEVAVEGLRLSGINARYTIFGVPLQPGARRLRRVAEKAPHLELELFGEFSPAHLPALLADCDVLIVPSLVPETFSIVMREGFACGLPVIASRIGALPAGVRAGDNGWLFEPGDATELAALLQELDGDRRRVRRAAAGIRPDDVTSVESRTKRIEAVLATVARRHGSDHDWDYDPELALMREALALSERSL